MPGFSTWPKTMHPCPSAPPTDDAHILELLRFWDVARRGRAIPAKADIDPLKLSPVLLPHLLLVDRVGRRYRYRLAGTAHTAVAGMELTGRYVDELSGSGYADYIAGLYNQAHQVRRPIYSESRFIGERDEVWRTTRRLICPLSDGSDAVQHFICAQTFEQSVSGIPLSVKNATQAIPGAGVVL
jgi:hypothetical protein